MVGAPVTRERFPDQSLKTLSALLDHGCSSARNHRSGYNIHNSTCIPGSDPFTFGALGKIYRVAVATIVSSSVPVCFLRREA